MAAQPKPIHVEPTNYLLGGGVIGWLTTVDHKRIAVLYGAAALFFLGWADSRPCSYGSSSGLRASTS